MGKAGRSPTADQSPINCPPFSCTSFRHCIAVGQHGYGVALIENWKWETAWSVVGDPKSAGLTQGSDLQRHLMRILVELHCCWNLDLLRESEALAMYWNGSNWVVQNTAVLRNSFDSELNRCFVRVDGTV